MMLDLMRRKSRRSDSESEGKNLDEWRESMGV